MGNRPVEVKIKLTPNLKIDIRDGLAGDGVDDLDVEGEIDAFFIVRDVLADVLAGNV